MKKKIFTFILLCICLILCGCGKDKNKEKKDDTKTSSEKQDASKWDVLSYVSLDDIISIEEIAKDKFYCPNVVVKLYYIKYKSDNLEIDSFFAVPEEYINNKKKSPCVIYNRDGYKETGAISMENIAATASILNTAVFASQYRGCTDNTSKDEFGGADVNDVVKLIDICEKFEFIDMNKLYMLGFGRGGMMTYMIVRKDERVKKAIVSGGISDAFTSYKYNKNVAKGLTEAIGGTPKTKLEEYKSRSAIYWANEIKCPVMIIHSKNDKQVSFKEAQAIVYNLKKNNKEYKLLISDNEGNELGRYYYANIVRWLEIPNPLFEN